jgi:penicillin-binding protein 1A
VATGWVDQPEPKLVDNAEQVLDPMTAYQITSMMEGVVQRGTAVTISELGRPIAGKTGTTNDEKDAWFIGFTPNLAAGLYIGYDKPAMGKAQPAACWPRRSYLFMKVALRKTGGAVPRAAGIKLIRIDAKSGMRAAPGDQRVILEAFKPGTAPPDGYSVIGVTDAEGRPLTVSPEADNMMRSRGTGGYTDATLRHSGAGHRSRPC